MGAISARCWNLPQRCGTHTHTYTVSAVQQAVRGKEHGEERLKMYWLTWSDFKRFASVFRSLPSRHIRTRGSRIFCEVFWSFLRKKRKTLSIHEQVVIQPDLGRRKSVYLESLIIKPPLTILNQHHHQLCIWQKKIANFQNEKHGLQTHRHHYTSKY